MSRIKRLRELEKSIHAILLLQGLLSIDDITKVMVVYRLHRP